MIRRKFITLLGSAAAWPVAARSQQRERVRRIGVLMTLPADNPEAQARVGAFSQGLQELGWAIGRNLRIDYRFSADAGSVSRAAAELVELAPEVILAHANPSLTALQQATRTLPIVFVAVSDPVVTGSVDSLARPGGNATGFTTETVFPTISATCRPTRSAAKPGSRSWRSSAKRYSIATF